MKHCIACGHELPETCLFTLEQAPASAQDIPDAREVETDRGVDLSLYQCAHCGLVQFSCEPVSYYRDVIRAGGFSTTMTELRRRQYRHLIQTYGLEGKRFVEVGCGRGEFLKVLTEFPVEAYGMEHKAELVELARQDGLQVWQEFPETSDQTFRGGPYDVFLSFNFLEHQPDPAGMLTAIYRNLAEDGMGLITVPALEYILEKGSYYELIRDHIAYYSFGTLRALLERCGFAVLEEEMVNRDTISMIVKKCPGGAAAERTKVRGGGGMEGMGGGKGAEGTKTAGECGLSSGTEPSVSVEPLVRGREIVLEDIRRFVKDLKDRGRSLALWGASHQGFTLAATTRLSQTAAYIIDSAPFKQGRFAPASHLPIIAPDGYFSNPVDAILIVAPGYTDEIAGIIRKKFGPQVEIYCMRTNRVERLDGGTGTPTAGEADCSAGAGSSLAGGTVAAAGVGASLAGGSMASAGTAAPLAGQRIVMTGATGFLGRNTARRLLDAGAEVFALVRAGSKQKDLLPKAERFHIVPGSMETVLEAVDSIGHADGFLHFAWGGVNREEIDSPKVQAANVKGSLDCLEAARRLGCRIFMDAGSRVEYGITGDGTMEESMECHPVNAYGKAKLEFYEQAADRCRSWGMTYYHLRFFSVYGTGDHPWSIISTLVRDLPQGKTVSLGARRHRRNFMDIEDASRAVAELYRCSKDHPGECHVVNVASEDTRVLKEFVEEIHRLCGGKGDLEFGTFVQAKEGALSICPKVQVLKELTGGTWTERVSFGEGIRRMLEA